MNTHQYLLVQKLCDKMFQAIFTPFAPLKLQQNKVMTSLPVALSNQRVSVDGELSFLNQAVVVRHEQELVLTSLPGTKDG